ncbi:cytochrome b N-terminal domain-containing protein [Zunongwangia sp. F363]|uniref:Cytochrome b N-terminal domain-containing protein n=1 Tax=Autumnicola tepida TaxID=3075595 RepID=A0ABU3C635_9FLAO|nr:cytochrome b N-terminal domain-containing protein [Zunongwangia sp. F363]MDT0641810.1 cytochrome b N-terminal domain-containing protein [Zunongwangia sp. F363]
MKKKLRKIGKWLNDRGGFSEMLKPLKEHLVPPGTGWNYVWGSATLFCLIVQVLTGIALAFLYQPSVNAAYQSMQYIENQAFMGSFIRGLHNWGASGMVVLLGAHMIRVYLTAAYKYPREMSWISGIFLLGITLTMAMTGQLLRWDSNAIWTGILVAEQTGRIPFVGDAIAHFFIGGATLGGDTLNRYFAMHVFLFPALLFTIVGYHLFLVLRNGISEPPKAGRLINPKKYRSWYQKMLKKKGVPFFPDVIWRDVVFSLGVLIVLILLGWLVGAPELTKPADPTILETEPTPDWYFKWIYAIFATMNRFLEPYFLFFGPLLGIILLFSVPFLSRGGERSPLRRPWAIVGVAITIVTVGSLTYAGLWANWVPDFKAAPLGEYVSVPQEEPMAERGKHLFYEMKCIYCHKIGKKGGSNGPALTKVENRLDEQQLILQISNGSADMPAYGGSLSSSEIKALVAFLLSEKKVNEEKRETRNKE